MHENRWLKRYSFFVSFCVLLLILKGALVTSHDAGLAVPDWPTSFGENMFLFPPSKWKGIIFFEHVHRLFASFIGFLTVILTVWIFLVEDRRWVKILAAMALFMVIAQGIIGGLTVKYLLPTAVSSAHAVLAQTFFILTIILAYSQTARFRAMGAFKPDKTFYWALAFLAVIYLQLIIGAVMRHSAAGLAVPDFPTMGGKVIPSFNAEFLAEVNSRRKSLMLSEVNSAQVALHLLHRFFGILVIVSFIPLAVRTRGLKPLTGLIFLTGLILILQFSLGVATLISLRQPWIASLHVMCGAALLGSSVIAALKIASLPK